jgi:hypothetical protein
MRLQLQSSEKGAVLAGSNFPSSKKYLVSPVFSVRGNRLLSLQLLGPGHQCAWGDLFKVIVARVILVSTFMVLSSIFLGCVRTWYFSWICCYSFYNQLHTIGSFNWTHSIHLKGQWNNSLYFKNGRRKKQLFLFSMLITSGPDWLPSRTFL